MHEFVESMYDSEEVDEQIDEICHHIGLEDSGVVAAKYLEHHIINGDTLDYSVYPSKGTSDFAVVKDITDNANSGRSANFPVRPIHELRQYGFIVKDVSVNLDDDDLYLIDERIPKDSLIVYIKYVGKEHPIIEYWE